MVVVGNIDELHKSPLVRATERATKWSPGNELHLKYNPFMPLDKDDLKALGLQLVKDHTLSGFMIVKPICGSITSALIERIDREDRITFATLNLHIKQ